VRLGKPGSREELDEERVTGLDDEQEKLPEVAAHEEYIERAKELRAPGSQVESKGRERGVEIDSRAGASKHETLQTCQTWSAKVSIMRSTYSSSLPFSVFRPRHDSFSCFLDFSKLQTPSPSAFVTTVCDCPPSPPRPVKVSTFQVSRVPTM